MPRGTTGRAVSATIHIRLREALQRGEPMSFAQLAAAAGCTVRSVRNYLARARDIFGFDVEQRRAPGGHVVLVRALVDPLPAAPPAVMRSGSIAERLRDGLFHAEPAGATHRSSPSLLVAFRGLPAYTPEHERLLEAWLQACEVEPRRAVRLSLSRPVSAEALLWPLGAVFHNLDGLLLLGLPIDAESPEMVQAIELDAVRTEVEALRPIDRGESGDPSLDFTAIDLRELVDLPFCSGPRRPDTRTVDVHVRFDPSAAERVRSRWWHKGQSAVLRTDGCLDVEFGPVPLGAAAGWVASWGDAVKVVGDKKLRKAVKKRDFAP